MNPRPFKLTPEQREAAARELVAELVKSHEIEASEADDAVRDIVRCAGPGMDGYALAKELDSRCYWDCDLQMAEALDGYSWAVDKQRKAAVLAWFEAEKPECPAKAGDRIEFTSGRETKTGTIEGTYEHGVAQFLVKVDGDPNADGPSQSRLIVDWERARVLA